MSEVLFYVDIIEYYASNKKKSKLPNGVREKFSFQGSYGIPTFKLLKYKNQRILWFRGTKVTSWNDLYIDFNGFDVPFLDGYCHKGYLEGARKVIEMVSPFLQKDQNITCVGHSLGGACATVVSMILKYQMGYTDVHAMTIGTPGILSKNLAEKIRGFVTTFVRQKDPIPRMFNCKENIYKLTKYQLPDNPSEEESSDSEPINNSAISNNPDSIGNRVPGRVIIIEKTDNGPNLRKPIEDDFIFKSSMRFMSHCHLKYHRDLHIIFKGLEDVDSNEAEGQKNKSDFAFRKNTGTSYAVIGTAGAVATATLGATLGVPGLLIAGVGTGIALGVQKYRRNKNKIHATTAEDEEEEQCEECPTQLVE